MRHLWDIMKESKYRVDFTYKKGNNFVWKETTDLLDNKYDATEFIQDVYFNSVFPTSEGEIIEIFKGCDGIKVEIVEIATNKIISVCWWWDRGIQVK